MDVNKNRVIKKGNVYKPLFSEKLEKNTFDAGKVLTVEQLNEEQKKNYFEKMLSKSREINEELVRNRDEQLDADDWEIIDIEDEEIAFVQKLPVEKVRSNEKKAEKAAIKTAKNTFVHADVCTVREEELLKTYTEKFKDGKHPEIEGTNEPENPALADYVDEILKFELADKHLTDDYLSGHIGEMYEYSWKLEEYGRLKEKYPAFFNTISETKSLILEEKASMAKDLKKVLDEHVKLHGLKMSTAEDGSTVVELINDKNSSAQDHAEKAEEYKNLCNDFCNKNIHNIALITAQQYVLSSTFKSKNTLSSIMDRVKDNEYALDNYENLINDAFSEIKSCLAVRDGLLKEQKEELQRYSQSANKNDKKAILNKIKANNSNISMATSQLDHFRYFIDFSCGNIKQIPEGTISFLSKWGKADMVNVIKSKQEDNKLKFADAYEFLDKTHNKYLDAGDSKEMQAVTANMADLLAFLGQDMPPLDFDEEAISASCLIATALYNTVITSIDACLSKSENYNNNDIVKEQLTSLKNMCLEENDMFRQKVFEYREVLADNSIVSAEKLGLSWHDAISYERAVVLNLNGEDGVKMEKLGGNNSVVYKLSTDKGGIKENKYFKKDDYVSAEDNKKAIDDFLNKLETDKETRSELKQIFEELKKDEDATDNKSRLVDVVVDIFDSRNNTPDKILKKFKNLNWNVSKAIKNSKMKQSEIGKYLAEFCKTILQREIAMDGGIDCESNLSKRNVATSRMAQLLGLEELVCDSRTCYVKNGKKMVKGNLMEEGKGKPVLEISLFTHISNLTYSPKAINQLFSLQVFDFICGQIDRHAKNFLGQTHKVNGDIVVDEIKAIDNDMSFGKLAYNLLKNGDYYNVRALNKENLKGLPIQLINSIMNLKKETVKYLLCDILSSDELIYLWDRIRGVQLEIDKIEDIKKDKSGRYYFEGDDSDDTLRQINQLRKKKEIIQNGDGTTSFENSSVFVSSMCTDKNLNKLENERKKELNKN